MCFFRAERSALWVLAEFCLKGEGLAESRVYSEKEQRFQTDVFQG